jgi:hypothetical protein
MMEGEVRPARNETPQTQRLVQQLVGQATTKHRSTPRAQRHPSLLYLAMQSGAT